MMNPQLRLLSSTTSPKPKMERPKRTCSLGWLNPRQWWNPAIQISGAIRSVDPLNVLFADENIGLTWASIDCRTRLRPRMTIPRSKRSSRFIQSQWVAMKRLRFAGGLRMEDAVQDVQTFSPFSGMSPLEGVWPTWLPVSSTVSLTDDMQLRAGYGRTVSRPEFRELSPARFDDGKSRSVVGNPELDRGLLDRLDLRWEWYFFGQDSLSIAGFYKSFTNPSRSRSAVVPIRL